MPARCRNSNPALAVALHEYASLLRRYLGNQRGAVSLMAGTLLLGIAFQLAGQQVVRAFIDAAQQGLTVLATYWSERVAWTATNRLRLDLTAHLLGLDAGFHQVHTPGELIERVDGDVNALAGFFSSFTVHLAGNLA
ncbi:MAG TPA: ABC transporter transmembrane domain-containing protein, partial [Chloroflexota bacterium]